MATIPLAIPAAPQKQRLPQNPFDPQDQPGLHYAYSECLTSENEAGSDTEAVFPRCLGYLLTELPGLNGKHPVADDILLCKGEEEKTKQLAQLYINHLIRLFRQNKGQTPATSHHPSRPSFDGNSEFFSAVVEPAPKDHRAAKRAALERDGYRCMVTGRHDMATYMHLKPAEQVARGWNTGTTATNFCHIFPPSTNWDLNLNEPGHPNTTYAGTVWNLIYAFGDIQVLDELNGSDVHRLSNGLTLSTDVHYAFDHLALWFEEVPNSLPNTYYVRTMVPIPGVPTTSITFTSMSPDLALPDPRFLKLHAAVCRVAHMSGAAEYLDKHDRDLESMTVLANDGSSSELLTSRLHTLILAF